MKAHPKTGRTIREEAEWVIATIATTMSFDSREDLVERAILRYAAPRYTKNGNGKPKDAPDPRVKAFIEWFCEEYYIKRSHAVYVPQWHRDAPIVKKLLAQVGETDLQLCARILLDERTDDKFIQESDRGIGMLSTKINWLNQRRAAFLAKQMRQR